MTSGNRPAVGATLLRAGFSSALSTRAAADCGCRQITRFHRLAHSADIDRAYDTVFPTVILAQNTWLETSGDRLVHNQ